MSACVVKLIGFSDRGTLFLWWQKQSSSECPGPRQQPASEVTWSSGGHSRKASLYSIDSCSVWYKRLCHLIISVCVVFCFFKIILHKCQAQCTFH